MFQKLTFKKATTFDLDKIIFMYRKSFKGLYEKYLAEDTNPNKESKRKCGCPIAIIFLFI